MEPILNHIDDDEGGCDGSSGVCPTATPTSTSESGTSGPATPYSSDVDGRHRNKHQHRNNHRDLLLPSNSMQEVPEAHQHPTTLSSNTYHRHQCGMVQTSDEDKASTLSHYPSNTQERPEDETGAETDGSTCDEFADLVEVEELNESEDEEEYDDALDDERHLHVKLFTPSSTADSASPSPTTGSTTTMIMASAETTPRICSGMNATPVNSNNAKSISKSNLATDSCNVIEDNGRIPDLLIMDTTSKFVLEDAEIACSALLPGQLQEGSVGIGSADDGIHETYLTISVQVFIPFLIAGLGMVGAGLALDKIQHWPVFEEVTELVILIPALLGLKGNLEMTLASRLSTQANLGHMDTTKQIMHMILGNLTLIQCQAIVVGFLGSMVAIIMGGIKSKSVELDHAYLLCASSLVTVSIASFVLGLLTAGVIVLSRHCRINPDNVATPIAASLGDITSLSLLSWVATLLYDSIGTHDWLAPLIIALYLLAIPLWIWIAKRNLMTRDVLYHGWTPVVGAMLISSMGGLILDFMVARFEGIAVFQPVINGVGGNLVAVQASRISTALHKQAMGVPDNRRTSGISERGATTNRDAVAVQLEDDDEMNGKIFITPVAAFCGKGAHARTTRILMAMVLPGHLIFIYLIDYMKAGDTDLSTWFVIVYLLAAVLQVATLLYCAYIMIHWMWKRNIDPDNSAIPYLTSLGDLLGISLLAIAFQFLYLIGDSREMMEINHLEGVH